ncbi:S8 family serine peptidase [Desulfitobacterium sp. THU1]|uniref:S8 family serine peptidase n=1 Tax=Desulfitobacterium sp. THU1 TaxID=3138072 RepID=UPI00311EF09B
MPNAWDISRGSDSVYVAVIDSGIYRNHPDFAGANIRSGWDFIFDDYCDWDSTGHGTNVTGVIGAQTNNAKGVAGVNWNVAILPMRVIWSDGTGSTSDVIQAIYLAANLGCDVINLSLGGNEFSSAENSAIAYAIAKGSIVVASAGNSGTSDYSYPASYNGVLSVGSIDSNLSRSSFSQYNDKVDLTAPGSGILTTADWIYDGDDYVYVDAISFSAPYVSGVAALASAIKPSITAAEFSEALKEASTDLGAPGFDFHYGYGLLNAEKTLR